MSSTQNSARPPQPNIPFLDATGNVSRPWYYFFLALYNRTGGTQPPDIIIITQQVSALAVQEAMEDVQFPAVPSAIASLVSLSLADDVPAAPLNPLLAALLISDAVTT